MNLAKIRDETPGCEHRIHLNNAGASLMPRSVIETVESHFQLEANIGGYEAESEASDEIAIAYEHVSSLLGRTLSILLLASTQPLRLLLQFLRYHLYLAM